MPDEDVDVAKMSPWLLRIELDREAMSDKNLTMDDITTRLLAVYGDDSMHIICNDDNADKLVMRVRMVNEEACKGGVYETTDDEESDFVFLRMIEAHMLSSMTLRGVEGIVRVFMREPKREQVNPDSGKVEMVSEWVLDTEGVNLTKVSGGPNRSYLPSFFVTSE